jgi:large subunit ribosomal protein L22
MPDTDTRETVARLRHLMASPTKLRPVLRLIAGKDVASARDTLRLSERAVSHDIGKVLDSAVANAEHNDNIPEDELYVARAYADDGPTLKRWRPRARGRGTRIRKRTTHLTIVVARYGDAQLETRRRAEASARRGPRRPTRRRVPRAAEIEHDHEHDEEVAEDVEETGGTPAEKATKRTAKKATRKTTKQATEKKTAEKSKKSTAKKSTAKKSTAKKSTAKKSTAEKTTAKTSTAEKTTKKTTAKKTTAKKATKKSTADPAASESDEDA